MKYFSSVTTPTTHNMKGFTLLEMMVVLVLVSLITVLLMQGFSFVVGLQERIRNQLVLIQELELREQWFRIVVRSHHRGRAVDQAPFIGEPNEMSGLVLQALVGGTGMPTKVTWRLERQGLESVLSYQEAELEPVRIMAWSDEAPEFRFLDASGTLNEYWPPRTEGNSLPFNLNQNPNIAGLPKGVALLDTSGQGKLFWYVSISSNTPPEVDFAL